MKNLVVLKEQSFQRVAAYPKLQEKLSKLQLNCLIEESAGELANFSDDDFRENGWTVCSRQEGLSSADILVTIAPLPNEDFAQMKQTAVAVGLYEPYNDDSVIERLAEFPVRVVSMDMIPRTTIAQSMDVLSSMASLSGYKAVLVALEYYQKLMPLMMTAAGTIRPAQVLVLGAGVAGLQSIATAKRLGAVVEAFDTRAAAKEEVKSLGGKFIEVEGAKDDEDAGGYAVEQSEEFIQKQRALVADRAAASNIIITTAQVRGRKAPMLVPDETLNRLQPGTVLVDLASSTGGNIAHSKDNQVIRRNGLTIIGNSNLSDLLPQVASELYGNNIYNFLNYLYSEEKQGIDWEQENEIIENAMIQTTN